MTKDQTKLWSPKNAIKSKAPLKNKLGNPSTKSTAFLHESAFKCVNKQKASNSSINVTLRIL